MKALRLRRVSWLLLLCLSTVATVGLLASKAESQVSCCQGGAPVTCDCTLRGTIKVEGNTYTFVTDQPTKSWAIVNPDKVKQLESRHVEITAHVYSNKNKVSVVSVKTLDDRNPKNK